MEEPIPGPPPTTSKLDALAVKLYTTPGGAITLFSIIGTLIVLSVGGLVYVYLKRRKRKPRTPENADVEKFNNTVNTLLSHNTPSTTSSPITPPPDLPFLRSTDATSTSMNQTRLHETHLSSFKNRFRKLFNHTIPKAVPSPKIPYNRSRADSLTGIPWLMVSGSPRLSIFADLEFNLFTSRSSTTPVLRSGHIGSGYPNLRNSSTPVTPSPSLADALAINSSNAQISSSPEADTGMQVQHEPSAGLTPSPKPDINHIVNNASSATPASLNTPKPIPSIVLSNSGSSVNVIFDPATNKHATTTTTSSRPYSSFINFSGAGLGFGFSFKNLDGLDDDGNGNGSRKGSKRSSGIFKSAHASASPDVD